MQWSIKTLEKETHKNNAHSKRFSTVSTLRIFNFTKPCISALQKVPHCAAPKFRPIPLIGSPRNILCNADMFLRAAAFRKEVGISPTALSYNFGCHFGRLDMVGEERFPSANEKQLLASGPATLARTTHSSSSEGMRLSDNKQPFAARMACGSHTLLPPPPP